MKSGFRVPGTRLNAVKGRNSMKCKRVISAGLVLAFVMGFTGCNPQKNTKAIEDLLKDYNDALNDLDADAVRELSDWSKKDSDYKAIEDLLDVHYAEESAGDGFADYVRYVASTIEVNYDIDDFTVKDDKATLKVEYELADWKSVLFTDSYTSYDEVINALKSSKSTITIKSKIVFEKQDGEWKLCQLSKLKEVFEFTYETPYIIWPVVEPDPTGTDPYINDPTVTEPSGTGNEEPWEQVVDSAIAHLRNNEKIITDVETDFEIDPVTVCDLNKDGYPELIYLKAESYNEGMTFSADLVIATYLPYAGEYVESIVIPDITYMAGDGGSFICFTTDKEIIVSYSGGEESDYHVDTMIYDFDFGLIEHYQRHEHFNYDYENDDYWYSYDYLMIKTAGEDVPLVDSDYYAGIGNYIGRADVVFASNYAPWSGDPEYGLVSKPKMTALSFVGAIEYLVSML